MKPVQQAESRVKPAKPSKAEAKELARKIASAWMKIEGYDVPDEKVEEVYQAIARRKRSANNK